MINQLVQTNRAVEVQDTTFTTDVLGRYICSTWDEATMNGGVAFDVIVIGAGMFGAYCAEKLYRLGPNLRVLVLDADNLLVTEHTQNLARIGLNAAGPKKDPTGSFNVPVVLNADDPGTRERVWGIPMRSMVPFSGLAYCLGGRSLCWGGWSPRLTDTDLAKWPQSVATELQSPAHAGDAYERVEKETGVFDKTDYILEKLGAEPNFIPLGTGGLDGWKMAGSGGFIELGGNIIESAGGIGLLWFTRQ